MTKQDASLIVTQKMQQVAEHHLILGCPARLDESLTLEYDWGWLFVFVPIDPNLCIQPGRCAKYALDRVTGNISPVGKKGVSEALKDLMKWRR